MIAHLRKTREMLRTSFWFTPLVMMAAVCGLAAGMLEIDRLHP